MKLHVSNIDESYKDIIIGNMENSGTADLLLHIVKRWHVCTVNEENQDLPLVIYCSHKMYKYYSRLGFYPINTTRERNKKTQRNIQQYNAFHQKGLHVDCLQDSFVMHNDEVIICKR